MADAWSDALKMEVVAADVAEDQTAHEAEAAAVNTIPSMDWKAQT